MLKERLALAQKVAAELHEAEAAIDAAILKMSKLMATMPEAQTSAKLSPVATDAAFVHMSAALGGIMSSRTNMVALHNELNTIKDKMGLRNVVVGTGDLGKLVPGRGMLVESDPIVEPDVKAA